MYRASFSQYSDTQKVLPLQHLIWKRKISNRMTASILKQDPNTKRFKQMLIYFDTDTLQIFREISFVNHKMTLKVKQQINCSKQRKMREKRLLLIWCMSAKDFCNYGYAKPSNWSLLQSRTELAAIFSQPPLTTYYIYATLTSVTR